MKEEDNLKGQSSGTVRVNREVGLGLSFPYPILPRPVISLAVYVDVKDKERKRKLTRGRAQQLCESRGGRPGLPVPNSPYYGLCGRKATPTKNSSFDISG